MAENIVQMDAQALKNKAGELKKELFDLRMQASTMQVKDYALSALGQ